MSIYDRVRELALIRSSAAVLGWDQETFLPTSGVDYRAKQIAWLLTQAHRLATSSEWTADLKQAESETTEISATTQANLRELKREHRRAICLPVSLVERDSISCSLAKHAWAEAREKSDFSIFAPHLGTQIAIAREKAELWGYQDEPYDALLEEYERGTSTAEVAALFAHLKPAIREISARAVAKTRLCRVSLPSGIYPIEAQVKFNALVAASIGFDFQAGRIDTTTHPFCTTLGPADVRLTTRYTEGDFTSSLFGVLHELGHGLYEQGLPTAEFGLPSGSAVSLGIHESQSRLWENHVGRSARFWQKWYPMAQTHFVPLRNFPLDDFLKCIQRAQYSAIRVEADEATYDLHIILRFELERRMINGTLNVQEIPFAWNEAFHDLFGFFPEDHKSGCLQDIHWSMGGLGYFATYTLGNINAAQLFYAASRDPKIAEDLAEADYSTLLNWLRKNVHQHGACLNPSDLILSATGRRPSAEDYLSHLSSRYL